MRVSLEVRRVEANQIEQLGDARAPRGARADPVNDERLLDDLPRAHARVERGIRILEDDLHLAPRLAHTGAREREDVLAAKLHLARRRLDEPQHAAARRRLAAARFADQPERFALFDREAHVVDGVHDGASA